MSELDDLMKAFGEAGGDTGALADAGTAHGEGAEMRHSETHYHGLFGGIEVVPKLAVKVQKNGRYFTDFTLTTGGVGRLAIGYSVDAGEGAVAELTARVFGHASDEIAIQEKVALNRRGGGCDR